MRFHQEYCLFLALKDEVRVVVLDFICLIKCFVPCSDRELYQVQEWKRRAYRRRVALEEEKAILQRRMVTLERALRVAMRQASKASMDVGIMEGRMKILEGQIQTVGSDNCFF